MNPDNKATQLLNLILDNARRENCKIAYRNGDKLTTIFQSVGNPSGLHSFFHELRREKFEKAEKRLRAKLEALISQNTPINYYEYRNVTRDRGIWHLVATFRTTAIH